MSPLPLALLAALGIALMVVGQRISRGAPDPVDQRLALLTGGLHRSLEELEMQRPLSERVLRPFIRSLARAAGRGLEARSRDRGKREEDRTESIRRKLALAGNPYRWSPADYIGVKIFAALTLAGVLFFLLTISQHVGYAMVFAAVGAAIGWVGPDLSLGSRTRDRQRTIQRALPDALDLLVISVEAGLGFDAAIQHVVDKRSDALALEFARVLAEMRVGRSRRDAFKDMVQRTQVQDLSNFVAALMQAEQLGVTVSKVLSAQAEHMRVLRRQRAEEKAAQLQLKMIFPLAIFIFPALCVVVLGPIWPTIAAANAPGI
jgi:tight adherence protein C